MWLPKLSLKSCDYTTNAESCGYLSSPRYGHVSVTSRGVGGNATYTCNSGFRLVGTSTRTCLSDGSWSGSQPTCDCMFCIENTSWFQWFPYVSLITDTLAILCPTLSDPGNGYVSVSSRYVGERAYYRCDYGYELVGSFSRTCQLSGNWSGTKPTCISEY